ncbi:(ZYRO0E04158g) [Zygosaccharomyces parabailii]|nr:(ZYRO0E04158g) [Zygosaccharomyces parabailii]CDH16625.1 probable Ammonia transport outward protein 2 [Zygosaccharomyces bailii ISA1307]
MSEKEEVSHHSNVGTHWHPYNPEFAGQEYPVTSTGAGEQSESPDTLPSDDEQPRGHYADNKDTRSQNSLDMVGRITTEGENNEYIRIGRQKFLRDDLYQAFGGTLQPGLAPAPEHKFANPAPLGLSGFALTTFVLSLINAKAQGVTVANGVVGPAMFYGGLVQLVAGIWEIALENTFGGTALCSYGGFWLSFATFYIPWFGVVDAYVGYETELGNVIGFFLLGMSIFTFGLTACTMKSTVMFFLLFFLLAVTFLLLSIAEFTGKFGLKRAGGILGVIVSFIAWYNAFAGLANKRNSYLLAAPLYLPSNEYTVHSIYSRKKHT